MVRVSVRGIRYLSFPDQPAVHLGQKMLVSLLCKREIVFFTDHKPAGFISEFIPVVISADPDHRIGAQISLLQFPEGEGIKILWQLFGPDICVRFPYSIILSLSIINVFTLNVNGVNIEISMQI